MSYLITILHRKHSCHVLLEMGVFCLQLEDCNKLEGTDKEDKELSTPPHDMLPPPPPVPKRNFPGNGLPPVDQATDDQSPVEQVSQTLKLMFECSVCIYPAG